MDLLDVKKVSVHNQNFNPHGHTAVVWFVDTDNNMMYEPQKFGLIPEQSNVGIVLESLQSRHTAMAVVQDLQVGMTISLESIYHLEGIAD